MKYRINYKSPEIIEETVRLVKSAQDGDTRDENKLVHMYSDYTEYMVNKYSMKTSIKDNDDLRSAIYRGMLEGIRRYRDDMGTQFIYFAHNWMKKSIFMEAHQNYRFIRLPVNQLAFLYSFENEYNISDNIDGDDMDILLDDGYFDYRTLKETESVLFSELDSGQPAFDLFIDTIGAESTDISDKLDRNRLLAININKVLRKFPKKDANIVERLFGLNGKAQTSVSTLAEEMKTAKVTVIGIRTKLIRLMRHSQLVQILLQGTN